MRIRFRARIRQQPKGSHFIVIPAERIRFIQSELDMGSLVGEEVKVEVEL